MHMVAININFIIDFIKDNNKNYNIYHTSHKRHDDDGELKSIFIISDEEISPLKLELTNTISVGCVNDFKDMDEIKHTLCAFNN